MSIQLRIPRKVYDQMVCDLVRQHAFAEERVGVLFVRPGTVSPNEQK